jgi:hypothetical protein
MPIPGPQGPPGEDGKDGKDGEPTMIFVIPNAILPGIQEINFSDGNIAKISAQLPARLAFVNVEIVGEPLPKDRFAIAEDGNEEWKAGTLALCRDGQPMATYTLSRFKRSVLHIPFDLSGSYTVYIRPSFPCKVQVSHDGSTYQVRKIQPDVTIPSIQASSLVD